MRNFVSCLIGVVLCGLPTIGSNALQLPDQGSFDSRTGNPSDLLQKISIYPEDNRGPLSIRGPEEGLTERDIQKVKENVGKLYCPGTKYNNGGDLEAVLIGGEDQIVTNAHALIDDKGRPRDPLSKCFVQFIAHNGPDAQKKYLLALKDGLAGIKELVSQDLLRVGRISGDTVKSIHDDYAVAKLVERVPDVRAYQLSPFPYLHGCDPKIMKCQYLEMVSVISAGTKMRIPEKDLIYQSCELLGVDLPKDRSFKIFYSNCSGTLGSSGSIAFARDDDGELIRGNDGELMPIAILSRTADRKFDGQKLDALLGNVSMSIGLNGAVRDAINELAGKTH